MSVADEEEQESVVDEEEQESLCSRKRTRTCAVCGEKMADATLRRSSSKSQNHYILMMSISLSGQIEEKIARTRAVGLARGSRKFCHIHVVHAAQYLLAETVTAGNEISHFKDPKARGRTAYITDGDIPPHLVSALNRSAENRVLITSRDVSSFINDAFKRYYETVLWPVRDETYLIGDAEQSESVPKVCMSGNDQGVAVEEEMMSMADDEQDSLADEEELETLCSRRTCAVCCKKKAEASLRRSSSKIQNRYILMMSISLAGQFEEKVARTKVEALSRCSRKFCHIHVVHAAQYLLAETITAGNEISHFEDPKARGRTAYVTDGDIPLSLVCALNRSAENRVLITSRDVSSFINDAFKRYYGTSLWPVKDEIHVTEDVGSVPKVTERKSVAGKAAEPEVKQELMTNEEERCSIADESESDDMSDDSSISWKTSVEESKPTALQQYYFVKGSSLVQLFEYCPHCGHKLSGMQLNAAGAAAIVKFRCDMCSAGSSRVQRWYSVPSWTALGKLGARSCAQQGKKAPRGNCSREAYEKLQEI